MKKQFILITAMLFCITLVSPSAFAQSMDATLELIPSVPQAKVGDEFQVDIILKNPGLQNIISVRSWLEYNADALEGLTIDTEGSPFSLSAPGETEFSADEELVKIGRSNISGGFNQAEVKIATVKFKVKTKYSLKAQISPHDYQVTELGHTSVNIIDQGFPVNILSKKPNPALVNLNPGTAPLGVGGNEQQSQPVVETPVMVGLSGLSRPLNLKITTGSGFVDLKWDLSQEAALMGYNLYYGKTSGQYSRVRTIGKVGHYHLEGLNNNEVYYFAVTAYDSQQKESDYSDEVAIIVNEPLSSTSPFEQYTASLLSNIPTQPQNGPLTGWLAFSAIGLGGVLGFRKKTRLR